MLFYCYRSWRGRGKLHKLLLVSYSLIASSENIAVWFVGQWRPLSEL